MLPHWNKCAGAAASDVLHSPSLTANTVITSLSTSPVRLFPGRAVTHSPRPCRPTRRPPCEHLFQTERERDHPSAGLLRIFMTGWCHSGCSLAGILLRSPGRCKSLMIHQVSWLEAVNEKNRRGRGGGCRLQIASQCRMHALRTGSGVWCT